MRTTLSQLALPAALACWSALLWTGCSTQSSSIEERRRQSRSGDGAERLEVGLEGGEVRESPAAPPTATAPEPAATNGLDRLRGTPESEPEPAEAAGADAVGRDALAADEEDGDVSPASAPVRGEPANAREVLELLRQGREAEIVEAEYHEKRGDEAMAGGRFQDAAGHFEKAVKLDPSRPQYVTKRARALYLLGRRQGEPRTVSEAVRQEERVRQEQLLAEIDLRLEEARKALGEQRVDDAYDLASLAVDSIALHPELAGESRADDARRLLDRIRADRDRIEKARRDDVLAETNRRAQQEHAQQLAQRKAQIQDLLRKALQAIRRGEYRKVEELCQAVLEVEPDNKVASFWMRSATDRLLKERRLKVITDRLEARDQQKEVLLDVKTPYVETFDFPEEDYWQRVRQRQVRLQPRRLQDPEPIQKIKTALESTMINITFDDSPLQDVIDQFKAIVGINILINPSIEKDSPEFNVTQAIHELSAMSALRLILRSKGLGFTFEENTLVVTPAEEAREQTEFDVYNVSDLLMKIRDFQAPEIRLKGATEDEGTSIDFTDDFAEEEEELDPEGLMDLIKESSGGEEIWDGETNTIDHQRGQLLINATRELHLKVREVLENLREDSDLYVVIEARFIDITDDFLEDIGIDARNLGAVNNLGEPFGGVINDSSTGGNDIGIVENGDLSDVELVMGLNRWAGRVQHVIDGFTGTISGERLSAGRGIGGGTFQATWLEPFQVNVILRAVQEEQNVRQLTAPVVTAHNNERVYVSVITQRAYISDYELVSGGTGFAIVEVADPVVETFQEGVILDVDPTISHDKKYVTLDVRPTLATLIGGTISTIRIRLGGFSAAAFDVPIGIPEISLQQSFTSVTVPNGGTVLLGGFRSLEEAKYESFLPIVGRIPIIKNLMRRKAYLEAQRSLVILLTARIVDLRGEEERRFNPQ